MFTEVLVVRRGRRTAAALTVVAFVALWAAPRAALAQTPSPAPGPSPFVTRAELDRTLARFATKAEVDELRARLETLRARLDQLKAGIADVKTHLDGGEASVRAVRPATRGL